MADVYVGRIQSARSRLSPKKSLSENIQENLQNLKDIGGGDEGLMQGADEIVPANSPDYSWLHDHFKG